MPSSDLNPDDAAAEHLTRITSRFLAATPGPMTVYQECTGQATVHRPGGGLVATFEYSADAVWFQAALHDLQTLTLAVNALLSAHPRTGECPVCRQPAPCPPRRLLVANLIN